MDFQKVADGIGALTCIVSVEKLEDGSCGDVRIVTGNKAYIDSIEHPAPGMAMLTDKFVPNSLYTAYLTRDLNFEDFCFRSAVQKKCLHSYVHPDRYDLWFNMTFLPLYPDDGNLCYCAYIMEVNFEPNSDRISNVSGEIASQVLETALSIRGARDFRSGLHDAVDDVRQMCEAEYCGLLLVDEETHSCTLIGESFSEGSSFKPRDDYLEKDFYPIAESWEETISGSNCLIAKNDREMDVVKTRNPLWYESLKANGIRTIALFPLKSHNVLLGYMWASNFDGERSDRIKEILELTTFILGSEIANDLMIDQLKVMSSRDMLTGLLNRNELNLREDRLKGVAEQDAGPVGVVFADLNGLKRVNDSEGHVAGDRLLCNAAAALREVFADHEIFRAGGDEFVMILTETSRAQAEEKAAALREAAGHYPDVSFAVGVSFHEDCRNIQQVLTEADERMYADKKEYYASRYDEDGPLHRM